MMNLINKYKCKWLCSKKGGLNRKMTKLASETRANKESFCLNQNVLDRCEIQTKIIMHLHKIYQA